MPIIFDITHTTEYRYARPVQLGEHRLMFRPRDSHDLRVLATDLKVEPGATDIRMIQDAYSNSIALVKPETPAEQLRFTCLFTVEHTGERALDLPLSPGAETYPFEYSAEDRLVLHHFLTPFYDADDKLMAWAREFIRTDGPTESRQLLVDMTKQIRDTMKYQPRDEEGVQAPGETLSLQCGSCRDFATLMIEAVRRLGYAARFVSGYVYTPEVPATNDQQAVSGATHAWLQVYLPGAGWITFDPTNNLIGGTDLIRVAYARHASFASPVSGTWVGAATDYLGMSVVVKVTKRAPAA
ncbi:transglutaminase family protein [Piscinibacter sp. XHJ-5]|uniref:transglutaminase family protein n=1 Tax=Piscinibacter sp. XHJ-5 TaxID=3037797 RepID=UPI002452E3B0|nr:transglutaminase family protein [Piscinibacter sp. XHJ-5]